jgi:hypothetical protein
MTFVSAEVTERRWVANHDLLRLAGNAKALVTTITVAG